MQVYITGGSFGLGEALTRTFARRGHQVTVIDKEENNQLSCVFIQHDFKRRFRQRLSCDVLVVNHASFDGFAPFASHSPEYLSEYLAINLRSYLELILRARYRRLVFINSVLSMAAFPNTALYCACKSFMRSLLESLQREGQSVLVVYPFKINTPLFRGVRDVYTLDRHAVAERVYAATLSRASSLYLPYLFRFACLFSLLPGSVQCWLVRLVYAWLVVEGDGIAGSSRRE